MTVAPFSATAVMPVIDYEPHPVPAGTAASTRPGTGNRRRRRESHRTDPPPVAAPSERRRHAAAFADAALRRVLEVVDRRRPAAQLRQLMDTALFDAIAGAIATHPGPDGTAVLRRVVVQSVDPAERAFEVAAGYTRGLRRHALACRIEATHRGWRVVALQIG